MNPAANAFFSSVNNPLPTRNVYPSAGGSTLGIASSGASVVTTAPTGSNGASAAAGVVTAPTTSGLLGQPLTWFVVIIALFFVLGWAAKKAGAESEFSNIRLSGYNILTISLAAIIGIGAMKVLFARFPVPGLSTFIQAV